MPGVQSACVFGVPDPTWGELVAALLIAAPAVTLDAAAVAALVRERLAHFKRPRMIAFVTELPKRPSGKTDRSAAKELALPLLAPMK